MFPPSTYFQDDLERNFATTVLVDFRLAAAIKLPTAIAATLPTNISMLTFLDIVFSFWFSEVAKETDRLPWSLQRALPKTN